MSRSRKKHPIGAITKAESERSYKQAEHQRERHHARQQLRVSVDDADPRLHGAPFGDPYRGPKDGKQYDRTMGEKGLRK
jgi:hypothetical protein